MPRWKVIVYQEKRPEIGKLYPLRNCAGGYSLPDPHLEGEMARVIGQDGFCYRVRARGKIWELPPQLIDAGSCYRLASGEWIDDRDRRARKIKARSRASIAHFEFRRFTENGTPPF